MRAHKLETPEYEIAAEILNRFGMPYELVADSGDTLRYRIRRTFGTTLSSIVFSRKSLLKLAADPHRRVKIEYLQRDIQRAATKAREYRYPRLIAPTPTRTATLPAHGAPSAVRR